jgi:hypothetical protein
MVCRRWVPILFACNSTKRFQLLPRWAIAAGVAARPLAGRMQWGGNDSSKWSLWYLVPLRSSAWSWWWHHRWNVVAGLKCKHGVERHPPAPSACVRQRQRETAQSSGFQKPADCLRLAPPASRDLRRRENTHRVRPRSLSRTSTPSRRNSRIASASSGACIPVESFIALIGRRFEA